MAGSSRPVADLFGVRDAPDYRGIPTHYCPCGSDLFMVMASFADSEVSLYFTDAMCVFCKALVTVPTPVDELL